MSFKKSLLFLSFLLVISFCGYSQDEDDFELAEIYELRNEFSKAIAIYEKALEKADRSKQYEYWVILARLYSNNNQPKDALKYYTKLQGLRRTRENIFNFAKCLKYNGNYDQAKKQFERVKKNFPNDTLSEMYIASCDSSLKWFKEPFPDFDVFESKNFNSPAKDFSPIPVGDNIIFSTTRKDYEYKGQNNSHLFKYDLFSTTIDINKDYNHTPIPKVFEGLTTKEHEAGAAFSKDGNQVFFTRTVKGKTADNVQQHVLNIFYSEKSNGTWSEQIKDFKFNSDEYSTGHPALSSDGNRIIFMSDIPGGSGKADLYLSSKQNGKWSDGINLGTTINTEGNELFPYISGDTLFFASDGHLGMGKLDIFQSIYNKETDQWSTPQNLKYPINTTYDDFGLSTFGSTNYGFFCSNRPKGTGDDDIYIFSKNQIDKIYIEDLTVSVERNRFFGNIDAKVLDSKNQIKELSQQYTLLSLQAQPGELYTTQFLKEELIENSADVKLAKDPINIISQVEIKTKDKPVVLNNTVKINGITYNNRKVYVLQNDVPTDTLITDNQGKYTFEIPANKDYTFLVLSDNGLKDFKAIKYFNIEAIVKAKRGKEITDANVQIVLDESSYKLLTTDNYGKISFIGRQNQVVKLSIFKEGFFEKDTSFSLPMDGSPNISLIAVLEEKPKMEMIGQLIYQGKPIVNAYVDVIQGAKVVAKVKTNEAGEYKIPVFDNEDYNIVINKDGLFTLDTIIKMKRTGGIEDTVVRMQKMAMKEIKLNEDITLNSIYFEYNSFVINKESQLSLDKLNEFLQLNPKAIVEINSHTDSRGDEAYNLALSHKRVESVKRYLISKGMVGTRAVAIGYGESKPIVVNAATEAEHKKNRRTQFKVIDYLDYSGLEDPKLLTKNSRSYLVHVDSYDVYKSKNDFKISDKTDLKTTLDKDNTIKFFFGPFTSEIKAQRLLELSESEGYNDSYIQVFENGKERAYETE